MYFNPNHIGGGAVFFMIKTVSTRDICLVKIVLLSNTDTFYKFYVARLNLPPPSPPNTIRVKADLWELTKMDIILYVEYLSIWNFSQDTDTKNFHGGDTDMFA